MVFDLSYSRHKIHYILVRRVSRVLGRKPIIWDNLHANDYDPKRVYLGLNIA